LAVVAGFAVSELLAMAGRNSRMLGAIPVLLAGWVVVESWQACPDYIAYFNQFAGSNPEHVLVDCDLDWGQDLDRLSRRLQELHLRDLAIQYNGNSPLDKANLPPYSELSPFVPTTHGYAAVSARFITVETAYNGSYAWLKRLTPIETIGKSIYLYKFDR